MQNESERRTALIYVRVSTTKQDPKSQIIRCEEYCKQKGFVVEKIFEDKFTGGGDFMNRPSMKELLAYVRKKSTHNYVVIFDDLKRFARDVEFHLKLRAVFSAYDLIPHCLNYNFDDSPEGRFMETIHAAQAELERHQNRRQVIQKQQARLVAGYNAFRAPLGYTKFADKSLHGTIDKPNKEGLIIGKALKKYANGELSGQIDVARYLKKKGFFGKKKPKQYLDNVKGIMTNIFYAGYIEYEPWEVERRKGHHKGIISLDDYNRIQKRLNESATNRKFPSRLNPDFPLRGCINCGYCKRPYTAAKSRGNGGLYYKYFCQNGNCPLRSMTGVSKSVSKERLEDEFKELVEQYSSTTDLVELACNIMNDVIESHIQQLKTHKQHQIIQKQELENNISRIIDLASKPSTSDIVRKRYEQQIEEMDKKISIIRDNLNEKEIPSQKYRTKAHKIFTMLQDPYKLWLSEDIKNKKDIFYFIFEENLEYVPNDGYRTEKMSLPVRLLQGLRTMKSQYVQMDPKLLNQLEHFISHWNERFPNSLSGKK